MCNPFLVDRMFVELRGTGRMSQLNLINAHELDESTMLRVLLEGTATETGTQFFAALVKILAGALNTHGALVTEYFPETRVLRALAFWMGDQWLAGWEIPIEGTPCEQVVQTAQLVHHPDNIVALYPKDTELADIGIQSYMGVPLKDGQGCVLGHLAVIDKRVMPADQRLQTVFRIFAQRASAELQRLNAEKARREREEQLGRIVNGTMDAIIEFDESLQITLVNSAAQRSFSAGSEEMTGASIGQYIDEESRGKLVRLLQRLDSTSSAEKCLWIPGGLVARRSNGQTFAAEATLSRFEVQRRAYHALVLRDINDRTEAEKRIQSLRVQTEYLRTELSELRDFVGILGSSPLIKRVKEDIAQVAATNATVLITGESGTGKELAAGAIHAASPRRDKPFIRVNCAAIPATLIESEFFGHEKGAFTGATAKRDGRFALADGGTIFLDEIGEIPIDLQAKLLRVLQGGEFESVGSSKTRKVDVRVVAATNRNLEDAIRNDEFREDLYYRLNVFPIYMPALRERGDDVVQLAEVFVKRYAQKIGRSIDPLTPQCKHRLMAYAWPGNVRELQNVIERAVITSQDGQINLTRALPESSGAVPPEAESRDLPPARVLTDEELRQFERANLVRALEKTGWKIAGATGAAHFLGMSPSTLSSRMKALKIKRP
jgi:PAS domain S-box-containing protein